MMAGRSYIYRGHRIFVSSLPGGSAEGTRIGTVWESGDHTVHKVSVKALPPRKTLKTAQKDLDKWAAARQLKEVQE